MTWTEAEERADLLWADVARVWAVKHDPEVWIVHTAEGIRQRQFHTMDAKGHPTCHPDCIAREAALGGASSA